MATPHKYTVITQDRAKLGYVFGILACALSSAFVFIVGSTLNFFDNINIGSIILIPVSAGTFYFFIYMLFNKILWKTILGKKIFHIPDLAGVWHCQGESIKNADLNLYSGEPVRHAWEAEIKISQDWDKILIVLDRNESSSDSIMATLTPSCDNLQAHELCYVYENTPKPNAPADMKKHDGFCRIRFDFEEKEAEGTYFTNSRDRISHGTMKLKKRNRIFIDD